MPVIENNNVLVGQQYRLLSNKQHPANIITPLNILVTIDGVPIATAQSINPTEARGVYKVKELGFEGVVQIVPQNADGGTFTVTGFAVYDKDAFMYGFGISPGTRPTPMWSIQQQRVPMAVSVYIRRQNDKPLVWTFYDCWLTNLGTTINIGTITINKSAQFAYGYARISEQAERNYYEGSVVNPANTSMG